MRVLAIVLGLLACLIGGCGGGGGDAAPNPTFTQAMLDAAPSYFTSYAGDPDRVSSVGVTQYVATVSGSGGSYLLNLSVSYFDGGNNFVFSSSVNLNCTLNTDGTLTCVDFLDPTTVIDLSMAASTGTYYAVDGADNSGDTWQDLWYFAKPAGWLSAYTSDLKMLRHRTYESGAENYSAFVRVVKDGLPAVPTDIVGGALADINGNPITSSGSVVNDTYVLADCVIGVCTWSNITEVGYSLTATSLPVGPDYLVGIDTNGGGAVLEIIRFDEDIALPFISAADMNAAWLSGDLALSWTNPTGAINWDRITQIKVTLFDGTGKLVGAVSVDPTENAVTLPAAMVSAMANINSSALATWQIQTRTYAPLNPTNNQIARGYSNMIALPVP